MDLHWAGVSDDSVRHAWTMRRRAFKLGGVDAIFDVELGDVAPVRGDEGFEHCVLFDVARSVEAMPLAVEGVEDVGIVDWETDSGSDGVYAVLEGIVPDGLFALFGARASAFVLVSRSAEFLGESDEEPFRPADIAEPIRVFILDYFADELRTVLAEPFEHVVDVVHGEHDTEVA